MFRKLWSRPFKNAHLHILVLTSSWDIVKTRQTCKTCEQFFEVLYLRHIRCRENSEHKWCKGCSHCSLRNNMWPCLTVTCDAPALSSCSLVLTYQAWPPQTPPPASRPADCSRLISQCHKSIGPQNLSHHTHCAWSFLVWPSVIPIWSYVVLQMY